MADYLKIYHRYREYVRSLKDAERGRLFMALLDYSATGREQDLRGNERFTFDAIKVDIDEERPESTKRTDAARTAANARWNRPTDADRCDPMRSDAIGCDPMRSDANACGEREEDSPLEVPSPPTPPTPPYNPPIREEREGRASRGRPTLGEVRAYSAERSSRVDPERFFDFYESKGWKVGKVPMVDWKAAFRGWEVRDRQERGAQTKSEYRNGELEKLEVDLDGFPEEKPSGERFLRAGDEDTSNGGSDRERSGAVSGRSEVKGV